MPKETKTIDKFSGGRNDIVDPRDMSEGDFAEFVNLSNSTGGTLSVQGTIAMPVNLENAWGIFKRLHMSQADGGGGLFGYAGIEGTLYSETGTAISRLNRLNCQNFSNGYGLYNFVHDYNYGEDGVTDIAEIPTEFIVYGDGKYINLFDGQAPNNDIDDFSAHHIHIANLGDSEADGSNESVWHGFDWSAGVLRMYDANETNWASNRPKYLAHVARQFMTRVAIPGPTFTTSENDIKDNLIVNRWQTGDANLKQPKDAISSTEPDDNPSGNSTVSTDGTGDAEGLTFIPLTVVKAGRDFGLGNISFNTTEHDGWGTTDAGDDGTQIGGHNPTGGMQVLLEFDEQDSLEKTITSWANPSPGYWTVTCTGHGFSTGQQLIINGTSVPALNTAYEIYGVTDENTFTLENEYGEDVPSSPGTASLNINAIDDAMRTKWVFGISWLYDDGMETPVSMGYTGAAGQPGGTGGGSARGGYGNLMSASNAIDFTSYAIQPKAKISFLYNPSASSPFEDNGEDGSPSRYRGGWGLRCNGFRVYMKDVITGSVSSEWMLLGEVDFINGEYIIAAGANEWQALTYCGYHDDSGTPNLIAGAASASCKMRFRTGTQEVLEGLPAETFTILNGYDPEVTTNALYKTAVTNNRVRYIGNVMVPDKKNQFYDVTGGHTGDEGTNSERGQAWRNTAEIGRRYPDRVMKSPPGQMDVFPNDGLHFIDVASNDGDSITHLACYNDKLLQFKEHKVYLINVSNPNDEYLEGEFKHAGIIHPCQICETPSGLVWANDVGLFQFDGSISSITMDKLDWHLLKDSTLGTVGSLTEYYRHPDVNYVTNPPVVGFDRGSQKVIVLLGGKPGGNHLETQYNGGFIYDMKSKSTTQVKDIAHRQYTCGISNMRVMADGTLIYAYKPLYDATGVSTGFAPDNIATVVSNVTFVNKYTDTADFGTAYEALSEADPQWGVSTAPRRWGVMQDDGLYGVEFKTQDFALGDPAQRKKLYKIYITYRSLGVGKVDSANATNDWGDLTTGTDNTWGGSLTTQSNSSIRVKYFVNGDTSTPLSFTAIDNCTDSGDSTELTGGKSDWTVAALKPRTSSEANNVKSIQLWFYTEGRRYCDKDFMINDITLVYRKKSIK